MRDDDNNNQGQRHVYRCQGDYSKDMYFKSNVQRNAGVMIYLAISYHGPLWKHIYNAGNITAKDYQRHILPKLSNKMVELMDEQRFIDNQPYNYLDDNCGIHWGDGSLKKL